MRTILVAEDDPVVRSLSRAVLTFGGFSVLEADGGRAALRVLADARALDLVLTDLRMPGMNGLELAEARGSRLLTKPFTVDTLLTFVRGAMGESHQRARGAQS